MTTAARIVQECPACVWDSFGVYGLDLAFVRQHRMVLDDAGTELIRRPLIEGWRRRGYRVRLLDHCCCNAIRRSTDEPSTAEYDDVHQEAVDAITTDDLVHEAQLTDELTTWRRTHPKSPERTS